MKRFQLAQASLNLKFSSVPKVFSGVGEVRTNWAKIYAGAGPN